MKALVALRVTALVALRVTALVVSLGARTQVPLLILGLTAIQLKVQVIVRKVQTANLKLPNLEGCLDGYYNNCYI